MPQKKQSKHAQEIKNIIKMHNDYRATKDKKVHTVVINDNGITTTLELGYYKGRSFLTVK